MGFNNEGAGRLVFDLETAPLAEAALYLDQADAPANYKDPEKIAAYIAEKNAENLSRCALDVDLCRIVAIGVQTDRMVDAQVLIASNAEDEATAVRAFWLAAANHHLIGFNCLAFDLPVLLRRSLYLGVEVPYVQIDKYKHPRVTDLLQVLSFNGALKFRGLSFYARRLGIHVDDKLTGAEVGLAISKGDWASVATHCQADVAKTVALARRLGQFNGKTSAAA